MVEPKMVQEEVTKPKTKVDSITKKPKPTVEEQKAKVIKILFSNVPKNTLIKYFKIWKNKDDIQEKITREKKTVVKKKVINLQK